MKDFALRDELINKIHHLHKQLQKAKKNISALQNQNDCLKDVLADLASIKKEDYANCLETLSE